MKHIDFFYDFSCPYAYLAHTQIDLAGERAGATVRWRPFLLGGVFRAIGTPDVPAAHMSPAKARMNLLDMHRFAACFDVPFRMPPTHPNRTVLALRAAMASSDLVRVSRALFEAYWSEGLDVSQPDVVRSALDRAGFDGAALVAKAEDPTIKAALRAATDEALAAGVFGAPAFVVTKDGAASPELYWGVDRLQLVEAYLAGEKNTNSIQTAAAAAPTETTPAVPLEFWFDYSSPFAYLASVRVEALARNCGAKLRYRPFLLGGLFKAIGTPDVPLFQMPEPKRRHASADMFRWAERFGAPLRFPSRFPLNTVKALRMTLALPEDRRAPFVNTVYRAAWAEDRDISDAAVLSELATSVGHDGPALAAGASSDDLRRSLREATEEAERRGIFGAPSFFVGEDLFWGQDRMDFVERALRKARVAPSR